MTVLTGARAVRSLEDLIRVLAGARGYYDPRPGPTVAVTWSAYWGPHVTSSDQLVWTAKVDRYWHEQDATGHWWPCYWTASR